MYKPRRDQLAQFLPTQDLIRAFEELFEQQAQIDGTTFTAVVNSVIDLQNNQSSIRSEIEEVGIGAGTAAAQANSNAGELKRIADALELIASAPLKTDSNVGVFDYIDMHKISPHVNLPGRLTWNPSDDTLNIHHTDDVTQQVGQETYLRVYNTTGATLTNGSAIGYDPSASQFIEYIADGSLNSLYIAGIATQDIPNNTFGRVTVYGRVRGLDTTGTPYGETWAAGDLLYVSTTIAGGLTIVKPTAPNLSIPMGLVFSVHATDGEIGVRPTAEQQLFYGSFIATTDQSPAVINTAYAVTWDSAPTANGVSIGSPTSRIVVANAGLYQFNSSFQLTSSSASVKNVWLWYRINGTDVTDSALVVSLDSATAVRAPSRCMTLSLVAGDYIELMYASDSVNMTIDALPATAFAPSAPAAILTVNMEQQ